MDESRYQTLLANPGLLTLELQELPPHVVVLLDEVQRAALDAYVQLYVKEEIRAEALVRNLPAFLRFLPAAALLHGQVINVAGLARDASTARTTMEGYVGILQDTMLATLIPAFEPRLRVRERKRPKLYWVDPGLVRAAKRHHGPVGAEERGLFAGGGDSNLAAGPQRAI